MASGSNKDILERQGSGFVGHHGKDFLLTGDLASQMLNFRYGPDGRSTSSIGTT